MPHSNKETLSIGWCDNGLTEGKFTEGLAYTILMAPTVGVPINNAIRVRGNQIARQRMDLFTKWADEAQTDWLLWVDSDVVLTQQLLKKLWDTADKISRPVVTGIYFISKGMETSLFTPFPTIFMDKEGSEFELEHIHPLPENKVIKVDSAGMGIVLMHKSIIEPLRNAYQDQSLFAEKDLGGDNFVGEDIVFFRKLKSVGVPVYAHTGAIAMHMKRFALDDAYYGLFWNEVARQQQIEKEGSEANG